MTLTISSPTTGAYVGAGAVIGIQGSGPVPTGEWAAVVANSTVELLNGDANMGGAAFAVVTLGWSERNNQFSWAQGFQDAEGVAVSLDLYQFHADNTLVDSTTIAGFLWQPAGNIPSLFFHAGIGGGGGGGGFTSSDRTTLADVLANSQAGAFHSPLLGVMTTTHADGSPFSGGSAIDLVLPSIPLVQVVGLTWQAITIPDVGRGTVGVIEESSRRVLQAVIFHTLASGASFADQVLDARQVAGSVQFDSWNPTAVSLYIWPGFIVEVDFLLAP